MARKKLSLGAALDESDIWSAPPVNITSYTFGDDLPSEWRGRVVLERYTRAVRMLDEEHSSWDIRYAPCSLCGLSLASSPVQYYQSPVDPVLRLDCVRRIAVHDDCVMAEWDNENQRRLDEEAEFLVKVHRKKIEKRLGLRTQKADH